MVMSCTAIETNYKNFLSWSRDYEFWEFRLFKISKIMGKEIYLLWMETFILCQVLNRWKLARNIFLNKLFDSFLFFSIVGFYNYYYYYLLLFSFSSLETQYLGFDRADGKEMVKKTNVGPRFQFHLWSELTLFLS